MTAFTQISTIHLPGAAQKKNHEADLAAKGRATGVGVALGDGPVDVDEQTGVGGGVGTGEAEQAGAGSAGAAGDADLRAGQVQLGTVLGTGTVQADLLETDEVLSVGDAARNGDGDGALAIGGPFNGRRGDGGAVTIDLEPNSTRRVEAGSRAGSLGEVDVDGTGVVDVRSDGEGDALASLDGESLRGGCAGAELVAAHGGGADVLDGAVGVVVGCAAGVLPVGAGDATGGDAGDGVVGVSHASEGEDGGGELHLCDGDVERTLKRRIGS
jgi:hypothetical protein